MPTIPGRATRWLGLALMVAALLCLPLANALAQDTDLTAGTSATVASPNGEAVLLRAEPSFAAEVLTPLGAGNAVEVVGGPITDPNGTAWYRVAAGGQTGFVPAGALVAAPAAPEVAPTTVPEPTAAPAVEAAVPSPTVVAPTPEPTPQPTGAPAPEPAEVPSTTPAVAGEPTGETAVTTAAVNLRAEPRPDAPVLLVVPAGSVVGRAGDVRDGFAPVSFGGTTGWAALAFLTLGAGQATDAAATTPAAPPVATTLPTAVPAATAPAAATGAATATDLLNLRAGPSYGDEVLRVLPPGAPVEVTGAASGGFLPVLYNGTDGWVDAAYIDTSGAAPALAGTATAAAATTAAGPVAFGPARTMDAVNLRAGASPDAPVTVVVPAGAALEATGPEENGFVPVSFADQTGWVAAEFLRFEGEATAATPAAEPAAGTTEATPASPITEPTPAPSTEDAPVEGTTPAATGGSGLVWPVSGGSWEIMQGYNGSSHQNQDDLWQYYYSLDLVREDGATAGQTVVSPASGTVRWTDPSSGGIAIDIGGGHAVALYHVTVDPSIAWGDPVAQGQPIGTVSGPGGPGFAGTPHVHFALWETGDGGNWSRSAAPFVGPYAIAGQEFPDTGGGNQHRGTTFTP